MPEGFAVGRQTMRKTTLIPAVRYLLLLVPVLFAALGSAQHPSDPVHALTGKSPVEQMAIEPAAGPLFANPDNPRYFTDGTKINGKYRAVYLTGAHTWCVLSDCGDRVPILTVFDYDKYLDFVQERGYNFIKMWRVENVGGGENGPDFYYSPLPYERSQTECCAFDGGNKFDLTRFNQGYFDRLRERVLLARDRGLYVSIMLFDGWSVDSKYDRHVPWIGHPYNIDNNVNGIDGDINDNGQGEETHQRVGTDVTALQETYVRKLIDTVNDLDNVLYEISNESSGDNPDTPEFDGSRDWQYHMIRFVKDYESEKPEQHPVGMTWEWLHGNNQFYYDSPADWISPGGAFLDLDTYVPPATTGLPGSKIILSDTDHYCGICGSQQWVWKSFTRGENPIFMDIYDPETSGRGLPFYNPKEDEIRRNLTYTAVFASRVSLVDMAPQPSLCSSSFCLASVDAEKSQFIVYVPTEGNVIVDLSGTSDPMTYEWFNPTTGELSGGGSVAGGMSRFFNVPYSGDAVLFIYPALAGTPPSQPGTPSVTLAFPTPVIEPSVSPAVTPIPSGSGSARTLLLVLTGIFLLALLTGGLFWMFKQGDRSK